MTEHIFDTLIVGSGAAAYNAAHWLKIKQGKEFAIITEGRNKGTSRNTGSDKQTYYKMAISGTQPDSVYSMAETLFSGGGVDGDIALCEATGSLPSFLKLANLGIPFPTNEFGEYVGYKTDHDPFHRATSAGPLTSRFMVEALEKELGGVPYFDGYLVCKILTHEQRVTGVVAYHLESHVFHLFHANHVIWCTGGPASAYYYSVFPPSQTGMTGAILEAGAVGKNLGEWQYGLASVQFRWNVSGSYQQVIPRYFSKDEQGNEYDFLDDVPNAFDFVFLKGYQWPFDVRKSEQSSKIDCLVYEQFSMGRTVYMDFRRNPNHLDFSMLSEECYHYLEQSGILFGTPIERLAKMNPLAIEIYKSHNIDLYHDPLEVMVSAQHHNGGIDVDCNWETAVSGLYACGEVASTLGVYRPGGSALNASQVGSFRAISHILCQKQKNFSSKIKGINQQIAKEYVSTIENISFDNTSLRDFYKKRKVSMSETAAHIRNISEMEQLRADTLKELASFGEVGTAHGSEIPLLLKTYDLLVTQSALLDAMIYTGKLFGSRGSALVEDGCSSPTLENRKILTTLVDGTFHSTSETVRPIPESDTWFERVWANYRQRTQDSQP